jgi:DNA-binding transcriptional LysR family regulator
MNFTHLKAFYTVAKNGSFTSACKELYVSQPTISLQVQELEKFCANPLLIRKAKYIELTEEGQIVFSYAQKIFALAGEMEDAITELKNLRCGTLKIGATLLSVKDLTPKIIYALKNKYPGIKIQLFTGLSKEILEKVINFEYHVGIIARVTYPKNLIYKQIQKQKLYFITTDNKIEEKIYLKDLANYPIILQGEGAAHREIIINEFKTRNVPMNIYVEIVDPATIKSMVHRGLGGAFMPLNSIEEDINQGKFRVIEILDSIYFYFDVIYLRERRKSKTVRSIISTIFGKATSEDH